jgi:hypothetical protein
VRFTLAVFDEAMLLDLLAPTSIRPKLEARCRPVLKDLFGVLLGLLIVTPLLNLCGPIAWAKAWVIYLGTKASNKSVLIAENWSKAL